MTNEKNEYIYLDGMWLQEAHLLKLAMNVGSFALAEHYLCALLANAVIYGKREVILKVNEVREFYHVPQIPLPDDLKDPKKTCRGMKPDCTDDVQARFLFSKMTQERQQLVLKESLGYLRAHYNLFIYTRHWLGIFLVVRDRLLGDQLKQNAFYDFACRITPEDWPEKLRIGESTSKNFSREIDEEDRGEAYYDMENNPQQVLCDTFWDIVKGIILTEN